MRNEPRGRANTASSKAGGYFLGFPWARFFPRSAGWPRSWCKPWATSPASSPRGNDLPIPTIDGGVAVGVAGVIGQAGPTANRDRLTGIDVGDRQSLPLERIRLVRLNVRLANQAQLFSPHGDHIHLGGTIRMGLVAHPRLEGMPPKPPGHQGQEDFGHRIRL